MTSPLLITAFALIPMIVALIGGGLATIYSFPKKVMSGLQHFVAGIVVGAVATELLPKILNHGSPVSIGVGFVLGAAVMLGVHEFAHYLSKKGSTTKLPMGLLIGSALDLFLDGLLIGVSFLAGMSGGILIAISLSFCAFFLVLALSSRLRKSEFHKKHQYTLIILITILLPIGALVGSSIISHMPAQVLTETLAFGVAALLFLGIEELIAEAHKVHDNFWILGSFFLGFLVIIIFQNFS
ncbi:ZIP family metal transporter [Simkania sp.]|uniref:ZIP family metal transporter n=1 Tax=Simkania sp. TaxID=34094 RepID=UPI003B518A65